MTGKRKRYSADFKAKVALEALKGELTLSQLATSFFHTLKTERIHHRVYADRDQARRDLFGYIEGFYNPRRLHSALGYISPAEAERRAA